MIQQDLSLQLSSLDRSTFEKFIFNLWKLDNCKTESLFIESKLLPKMGGGVFEQQRIEWENPNSSKSYQGYNLVIPFYKPLNLFKDTSLISVDFEDESTILHRFRKRIEKKLNNWYFPQDGDFCCPNIYFVSNHSGIEKKVYYNHILPKLMKLVQQTYGEMVGDIGIGTIDSFVENVQDKSRIALDSTLISNFGEISIKYFEGRFKVENHISEGYMSAGVLKKSQLPCETVINSTYLKEKEILSEFEKLINNDTKELELESFIKKHYQSVFGNEYDRIETQLWLRFPELDINNRTRRLDIFLRNSIESDWELVELKGLNKVVKNYRDIPTFTSNVHAAISQLRNYQSILHQEKVKNKLLKEGIEYFEPELRLVVGRKPNITVPQWRRIKKQNEHGLKLLTYDDLISEMRLRIERINSSNLFNEK